MTHSTCRVSLTGRAIVFKAEHCGPPVSGTAMRSARALRHASPAGPWVTAEGRSTSIVRTLPSGRRTRRRRRRFRSLDRLYGVAVCLVACVLGVLCDGHESPAHSHVTGGAVGLGNAVVPQRRPPGGGGGQGTRETWWRRGVGVLCALERRPNEGYETCRPPSAIRRICSVWAGALRSFVLAERRRFKAPVVSTWGRGWRQTLGGGGGGGADEGGVGGGGRRGVGQTGGGSRPKG